MISKSHAHKLPEIKQLQNSIYGRLSRRRYSCTRGRPWVRTASGEARHCAREKIQELARGSSSRIAQGKVRSSEIGILTPAELARLLESASDETLPYWALGGFTGLRTAELERLDWAEVHFDF